MCPPPISAAHASACSQTSKNVKHVDARSGGGERCLSAGPDLGASSAVLHPGPPHPVVVREASTLGPSTPFPAFPRGPNWEAVEERAPAGLGGEPLARGPADFLLISSRKPAPVRACERLWGSGMWGIWSTVPSASIGGGHAGFLGCFQPSAKALEGTLSWEGMVLLQPDCVQEERVGELGLWGRGFLPLRGTGLKAVQTSRVPE